ncbi:unnamed protein product [Vitrella brassicaformis CCMP3155]|uniref:Uncharacterized protein n=4 Tax=Vitrella brassicaformis TaxID=1169539 RepID=A0A0G4G658_VITBC|nr:unnamed protein product [Vitrella brassicaformis CCMP3155]|eukprot:CEM24000.1 unnamed protein product [Vitrella brassicaformis CCMP3155]
MPTLTDHRREAPHGRKGFLPKPPKTDEDLIRRVRRAMHKWTPHEVGPQQTAHGRRRGARVQQKEPSYMPDLALTGSPTKKTIPSATQKTTFVTELDEWGKTMLADGEERANPFRPSRSRYVEYFRESEGRVGGLYQKLGCLAEASAQIRHREQYIDLEEYRVNRRPRGKMDAMEFLNRLTDTEFFLEVVNAFSGYQNFFEQVDLGRVVQVCEYYTRLKSFLLRVMQVLHDITENGWVWTILPPTKFDYKAQKKATQILMMVRGHMKNVLKDLKGSLEIKSESSSSDEGAAGEIEKKEDDEEDIDSHVEFLAQIRKIEALWKRLHFSKATKLEAAWGAEEASIGLGLALSFLRIFVKRCLALEPAIRSYFERLISTDSIFSLKLLESKHTAEEALQSRKCHWSMIMGQFVECIMNEIRKVQIREMVLHQTKQGYNMSMARASQILEDVIAPLELGLEIPLTDVSPAADAARQAQLPQEDGKTPSAPGPSRQATNVSLKSQRSQKGTEEDETVEVKPAESETDAAERELEALLDQASEEEDHERDEESWEESTEEETTEADDQTSEALSRPSKKPTVTFAEAEENQAADATTEDQQEDGTTPPSPHVRDKAKKRRRRRRKRQAEDFVEGSPLDSFPLDSFERLDTADQTPPKLNLPFVSEEEDAAMVESRIGQLEQQYRRLFLIRRRLMRRGEDEQQILDKLKKSHATTRERLLSFISVNRKKIVLMPSLQRRVERLRNLTLDGVLAYKEDLEDSKEAAGGKDEYDDPGRLTEKGTGITWDGVDEIKGESRLMHMVRIMKRTSANLVNGARAYNGTFLTLRAAQKELKELLRVEVAGEMTQAVQNRIETIREYMCKRVRSMRLYGLPSLFASARKSLQAALRRMSIESAGGTPSAKSRREQERLRAMKGEALRRRYQLLTRAKELFLREFDRMECDISWEVDPTVSDRLACLESQVASSMKMRTALLEAMGDLRVNLANEKKQAIKYEYSINDKKQQLIQRHEWAVLLHEGLTQAGVPFIFNAETFKYESSVVFGEAELTYYSKRSQELKALFKAFIRSQTAPPDRPESPSEAAFSLQPICHVPNLIDPSWIAELQTDINAHIEDTKNHMRQQREFAAMRRERGDSYSSSAALESAWVQPRKKLLKMVVGGLARLHSEWLKVSRKRWRIADIATRRFLGRLIYLSHLNNKGYVKRKLEGFPHGVRVMKRSDSATFLPLRRTRTMAFRADADMSRASSRESSASSSTGMRLKRSKTSAVIVDESEKAKWSRHFQTTEGREEVESAAAEDRKQAAKSSRLIPSSKGRKGEWLSELRKIKAMTRLIIRRRPSEVQAIQEAQQARNEEEKAKYRNDNEMLRQRLQDLENLMQLQDAAYQKRFGKLRATAKVAVAAVNVLAPRTSDDISPRQRPLPETSPRQTESESREETPERQPIDEEVDQAIMRRLSVQPVSSSSSRGTRSSREARELSPRSPSSSKSSSASDHASRGKEAGSGDAETGPAPEAGRSSAEVEGERSPKALRQSAPEIRHSPRASSSEHRPDRRASSNSSSASRRSVVGGGLGYQPTAGVKTVDISMMKQLRMVGAAPERIMEVVLGRREVRRGVMDVRKARKLNKAMHRYLATRFELLKKLVLVHGSAHLVEVLCGLVGPETLKTEKAMKEERNRLAATLKTMENLINFWRDRVAHVAESTRQRRTLMGALARTQKEQTHLYAMDEAYQMLVSSAAGPSLLSSSLGSSMPTTFRQSVWLQNEIFKPRAAGRTGGPGVAALNTDLMLFPGMARPGSARDVRAETPPEMMRRSSGGSSSASSSADGDMDKEASVKRRGTKLWADLRLQAMMEDKTIVETLQASAGQYTNDELLTLISTLSSLPRAAAATGISLSKRASLQQFIAEAHAVLVSRVRQQGGEARGLVRSYSYDDLSPAMRPQRATPTPPVTVHGPRAPPDDTMSRGMGRGRPRVRRGGALAAAIRERRLEDGAEDVGIVRMLGEGRDDAVKEVSGGMSRKEMLAIMRRSRAEGAQGAEAADMEVEALAVSGGRDLPTDHPKPKSPPKLKRGETTVKMLRQEKSRREGWRSGSRTPSSSSSYSSASSSSGSSSSASASSRRKKKRLKKRGTVVVDESEQVSDATGDKTKITERLRERVRILEEDLEEEFRLEKEENPVLMSRRILMSLGKKKRRKKAKKKASHLVPQADVVLAEQIADLEAKHGTATAPASPVMPSRGLGSEGTLTTDFSDTVSNVSSMGPRRGDASFRSVMAKRRASRRVALQKMLAAPPERIFEEESEGIASSAISESSRSVGVPSQLASEQPMFEVRGHGSSSAEDSDESPSNRVKSERKVQMLQSHGTMVPSAGPKKQPMRVKFGKTQMFGGDEGPIELSSTKAAPFQRGSSAEEKLDTQSVDVHVEKEETDKSRIFTGSAVQMRRQMRRMDTPKAMVDLLEGGKVPIADASGRRASITVMHAPPAAEAPAPDEQSPMQRGGSMCVLTPTAGKAPVVAAPPSESEAASEILMDSGYRRRPLRVRLRKRPRQVREALVPPSNLLSESLPVSDSEAMPLTRRQRASLLGWLGRRGLRGQATRDILPGGFYLPHAAEVRRRRRAARQRKMRRSVREDKEKAEAPPFIRRLGDTDEGDEMAAPIQKTVVREPARAPQPPQETQDVGGLIEVIKSGVPSMKTKQSPRPSPLMQPQEPLSSAEGPRPLSVHLSSSEGPRPAARSTAAQPTSIAKLLASGWLLRTELVSVPPAPLPVSLPSAAHQHMLRNLAAEIQRVAPVREEREQIVEQDGATLSPIAGKGLGVSRSPPRVRQQKRRKTEIAATPRASIELQPPSLLEPALYAQSVEPQPKRVGHPLRQFTTAVIPAHDDEDTSYLTPLKQQRHLRGWRVSFLQHTPVKGTWGMSEIEKERLLLPPIATMRKRRDRRSRTKEWTGGVGLFPSKKRMRALDFCPPLNTESDHEKDLLLDLQRKAEEPPQSSSADETAVSPLKRRHRGEGVSRALARHVVTPATAAPLADSFNAVGPTATSLYVPPPKAATQKPPPMNTDEANPAPAADVHQQPPTRVSDDPYLFMSLDIAGMRPPVTEPPLDQSPKKRRERRKSPSVRTEAPPPRNQQQADMGIPEASTLQPIPEQPQEEAKDMNIKDEQQREKKRRHKKETREASRQSGNRSATSERSTQQRKKVGTPATPDERAESRSSASSSSANVQSMPGVIVGNKGSWVSPASTGETFKPATTR